MSASMWWWEAEGRLYCATTASPFPLPCTPPCRPWAEPFQLSTPYARTTFPQVANTGFRNHFKHVMLPPPLAFSNFPARALNSTTAARAVGSPFAPCLCPSCCHLPRLCLPLPPTPLQASLLCSSWPPALWCGTGGGAAWPRNQTTTSSGALPMRSQWAEPAATRCGWTRICPPASPETQPPLATTAWRPPRNSKSDLWSFGGSAELSWSRRGGGMATARELGWKLMQAAFSAFESWDRS